MPPSDDAAIKDDSALGVTMDSFFSENHFMVLEKIEAAIESMRAKGLIYEGVLEPPKGKTPEDWEPRQQTLFKSTEHGDDVDRPVMNLMAVGLFCPRYRHHYDKVMRGYDKLIDVFGADHIGYVAMKAAVSALSDAQTGFDVKLSNWSNCIKTERRSRCQSAGTL